MSGVHADSKGNDDSYHCENTILGLHKWYVNVFEKLGWMLLCRGDGEKIKVYHDGIVKLIGKLQLRHDTSDDNDTKDDMRIMMDNTKILLIHVKNDFAMHLGETAQSGGAKKTSKPKGKTKSKPKGKTKSKSKGKTKSKSKGKSKSKSKGKPTRR